MVNALAPALISVAILPASAWSFLRCKIDGSLFMWLFCVVDMNASATVTESCSAY